jgi:ribosomal protein S18 acetylase RimI-like enzyme
VSSADIRIRPAEARDAEALARVRANFAAFHAALDPRVFRRLDEESLRAAYAERTALTADETLVAETDAGVVGFVELRLERPTGPGNIHRDVLYATVEDLAVEEAHRRRGIGEALMRAAERWARERGAEAMLLSTHPANEGALRFYRERLGYRTTGVTLIRRLR